MQKNDLLKRIEEALENKKAIDVRVIDIRSCSNVADYFVICSGTSTTHTRALADEVEEKLKEEKMLFFHKEGYSSSNWILLDYGSVVVHIMQQEEREYYNIEKLWSKGIVSYRRFGGTENEL